MTQKKNNIFQVRDKLLIVNSILGFIVAYCAFYELFLRYNVTNTGLHYKIINVGQMENKTEKDGEKNYFRIERCITRRGDVIEYPNQSGYTPFIYDMKNYIAFFKFDGGYCEALSMLKNSGDEIQIKIKAEKIPYEYGIAQLDLNPWDFITVKIKMVEKFDQKTMNDVFVKYEEERIEDVNKKREIDKANIENFIKKKNYPAPIKIDDLYVVVTEKGTGEKIEKGDAVKFNFYRRFHNGKFTQTNIESVAKENKIKNFGPFEFNVQEKHLNWLSLALTQFSNGSKGFVFSSSANMYKIDPSKSFYITYIEVLNVTKKKPTKKEQETQTENVGQRTEKQTDEKKLAEGNSENQKA